MNFEISLEDRKNIDKIKSIIVELPQEGRDEALRWSAYNDFMDGVKVSIELKADIDGQNEARRTPLHMAIMGRASGIALYLITLGAKVDIQDSYKRTALHYAVKTGDTEVVKQLVKVQYRRKSTVKSFWGFIKLWRHFTNIMNLLHPIRAYNGFKLEACHEYINQKDITGNNPAKYALMLDHENATNIQIYLLNRDGDPNPKMGVIESVAFIGLQMFLAPQLVRVAAKVGLFVLDVGAMGLDKIMGNEIIRRLPPVPPAIDPPIELPPMSSFKTTPEIMPIPLGYRNRTTTTILEPEELPKFKKIFRSDPVCTSTLCVMTNAQIDRTFQIR